MQQGQVWWVSLPPSRGSTLGDRRPVLVVQGNAFNRSRLRTVVYVPLTGNLALAAAPGNVLLPAASTGLPRDSVANVSQIATLDRGDLNEATGQVTHAELERVLKGIDLVLGRYAPPSLPPTAERGGS